MPCFYLCIQVTFNDIAGLDDIKSILFKVVKYPLENTCIFADKCIELPRAIILTGPTGTGKTLLCNALRNELKVKCFDIDATVTFERCICMFVNLHSIYVLTNNDIYRSYYKKKRCVYI